MAHKPPQDVEPSELFLKLCEPQPSEVVDFPRKNAAGEPIGQIRIRVLAQDEHDKARFRAFDHFKGRGYDTDDRKDLGLREVIGDRIAKELLLVACQRAKAVDGITDTDTGLPIYPQEFMRVEDLGKLRPEEVAALFRAYQLVQDKYGPVEHDCDVDAWVNRLAEGGSAFPFFSQDLPALANLTSSLAERISFICRVLGFHWEQLPPTCQSDLERSCSGIGSWCEQREVSVPASGESYPDEITIEDAIHLNQQISKSLNPEDISE